MNFLSKLTSLVHEPFASFVYFLALLVEILGVIVIVISIFRTVKNLVANRFNFSAADHDQSLGAGLAKALEIFLAGEILMTLLADSFQSLGHIAALVLIRVTIAVVIHWEAKAKEDKH
ncbi:MAG: DUF1622 domain-containing protein [Bacillota bacterium]|nr:DUF1622 domain-containing protein [Bacillota bacterium]